jgi:hypothetical protein
MMVMENDIRNNLIKLGESHWVTYRNLKILLERYLVILLILLGYYTKCVIMTQSFNIKNIQESIPVNRTTSGRDHFVANNRLVRLHEHVQSYKVGRAIRNIKISL